MASNAGHLDARVLPVEADPCPIDGMGHKWLPGVLGWLGRASSPAACTGWGVDRHLSMYSFW
eukprot:7011010-Lingulodinium_polyedra.AAC.1